MVVLGVIVLGIMIYIFSGVAEEKDAKSTLEQKNEESVPTTQNIV